MKRFVVLVLASAVAIPVLADDFIPAPWANDGYNDRIPGVPSTTFSEWEYDDPCGVYSFDPPENSWYVSHPDFLNPLPIDPCSGSWFSTQQWGGDNDPCTSDWDDALPSGRQGGVNFAYGSWDINNFVLPWGPGPGELIAKDFWVQLTYFNGDVDATDWSYEVEGPDEILLGGDLIPVADPCQLSDGYWHTAFSITALTPSLLTTESLSLYPDVPVLLDQIIIESYQYGFVIPEPTTMVLFGLGSLLMIRRKR